jgi:hypothetical protein
VTGRTALPESKVRGFRKAVSWSLAALYIILVAAGLTLQELGEVTWENFNLPVLVASSLVTLITPFIGVAVVARHPRHTVGWILCIFPLLWGFDQFAFGYAYYGLIAHPGSLPGSEILVMWLQWSGGPFGILALTMLFLVFPSGRLPSRGWRFVTYSSLLAVSSLLVFMFLTPGPMEDFPYIRNPFGVTESLWTRLEPLMGLSIVTSLLCLLAAAISLILRLRRVSGDERQQLKWFSFSAVSFPLAFLLVIAGDANTTNDPNWIYQIGWFFQEAAFAGMSAAIARAIFKYRLYDIDLIINRTMVYALVTGTLGVIYASGVAALQALFRLLTGQENQLAIVVTTLGITILFSPLRIRIQSAIDRRFYRHKYDAERALDKFAAQVRNEVDMGNIVGHALRIVDDTLQPKRADLWIRQPSGVHKPN